MPTVTTRKSGDVTILDLAGKMTLGEGSNALGGAVQNAVAGGAKKILVNMALVTTIDSSGIGEFIASRSAVTNGGGKLKVVNPPSNVSQILQVTQAVGADNVHDSEAEAVKSFK